MRGEGGGMCILSVPLTLLSAGASFSVLVNTTFKILVCLFVCLFFPDEDQTHEILHSDQTCYNPLWLTGLKIPAN